MINEIINTKHKELIEKEINNTQNIINSLSLYIKNGSSDGKSLLFEITRQALNKKISIENYLNIIQEIYKENSDFIENNIVDIFWLFGFVIEKKNENEDTEIKKNFSSIVNNLLNNKIITQEILIEKLEESTLFDIGVINDKKSFKSKITKINTKITYEQQKYNLLREESEGFSKMIFLLFQNDLTKESTEKTINKILCLIGYFDLDPNRVLNLILNAFEFDSLNLNFLTILKLFNKNAIAQLLGFKINSKVSDEKSNGLFIITAQLIKHKIIDFSDILPHITPNLKDVEESYKKQIEITNEFYKNLQQRVSKELSMVAVSAHSETVTQNANYFINFPEIVTEFYKPNSAQIYKLFEGFVTIRAYKECEIIFSLMEGFYDPLVSPNLTKALCNIISWMIEDFYPEYSNSFNNNKYEKADIQMKDEFSKDEFVKITTPDEFLFEMSKILKYLTLGLSTDLILFTKILVILKANSKYYFDNQENTKILMDLICKVFLPSISLIDSPPGLVKLLWSILSNLEYRKRYKIYNYWMNNVYSTHPVLYIKYGTVLKEAAKWQKTVSKENQRSHGRLLGILTNSNPTIVFDNVIRLLTSYDNQINVFMQTLSFCSDLSYDVITFIICKILADPNKEKVNETSGEMNSWFKYFCYFIGHFFKKFYFAEFSGIIHYITNRLSNSNNYNEADCLKEIIIEQYALKEIIEKMSGILIIEEMNESQVQSFAGGYNLILESLDILKDFKTFKKPISFLLKFFLPNNNSKEELGFTSSLLILLGIRRNNIIFNSKYTIPKLLGFLYDQVQNIYVQLVQFLSVHCDRETFCSILPDWRLEKYVVNYNCQPETIFFMVRNKFRPVYEMEKEEYDSCISQFMGVHNTYYNTNKQIFSDEFDSLYFDKQSFLDDTYKDIWKYLTPEMYFIFSVLQLKDIYLPTSNYDKEIEQNKREIEKFNEEMKNSTESQSKFKKEIERFKSVIENLEKERNVVKTNYEKVVKFLDEKKSSLFDENIIPKANRRDISKYLIQYCLYPRLIFSKVEALYTAKLLALLINLKIPSINVFDILQKLVKLLVPTILCVTESEAQNIGVFLLEFLKSIKYWQDEVIWENECFTNVSFSRSLESLSSVDLNEFKKVIVCLLTKMNSTFLNVFNGEDYMSCRNVIIVLNTINPVFPPFKEIANELISSIEKALEKFVNYEDLTMMMKRYRDIILSKKSNLPSENEVSSDNKEALDKVNGDKKKKKEKEKESKRREENTVTPEVKRRSPDEYRYKNRK